MATIEPIEPLMDRGQTQNLGRCYYSLAHQKDSNIGILDLCLAPFVSRSSEKKKTLQAFKIVDRPAEWIIICELLLQLLSSHDTFT